MTASVLEFSVDAMFNTHSHLRQGLQVRPLLRLSVAGGMDALHYMPNPLNGLKTQSEVRAYDIFALTRSAEDEYFTVPRLIPSVMITEETTEEMINECVRDGIIDVKAYPRDRTNSSIGIERYARILPMIRHCARKGVRVHLHPEHPSKLVGNRDAEFL